MTREEAIQNIKKLIGFSDTLDESIFTLFPEPKESEKEEKPNGGIVLEDFNEGNGFYKVNLAYLSKEQVEEIENIVKKWNQELAESEDERIRKALIDGVRQIRCKNGITQEQMLAYLEKQKESPKSSDSIPSDCVSDAKCEDRNQKHNISVDEIAQDYVDGVKEYNPEPTWDLMQTAVCYGYHYREQKEQKPITINQDEKEFLANEITAFLCNYDKEFDGEDPVPSEIAEHFYLLGKQAQEQKSTEWSEEDEKMLRLCENRIMGTGTFVPTRTGLYDMVSWLKSLRPQPKKELSIEKAIKWLDDTFYFLDNSSGRGRDCEITTHDFDSLEEMYDSFRKAVIVDSEPHWKPSEEQMCALSETIAFAPDTFKPKCTLMTLQNDLKKL